MRHKDSTLQTNHIGSQSVEKMLAPVASPLGCEHPGYSTQPWCRSLVVTSCSLQAGREFILQAFKLAQPLEKVS